MMGSEISSDTRSLREVGACNVVGILLLVSFAYLQFSLISPISTGIGFGVESGHWYWPMRRQCFRLS